MDLGRDEDLVVELHTHVKALFWPVIVLLLDAALLGAGLAWVPQDYRPYGVWVLIAACVLLGLLGCLRPFLRWLTTSYVLTSRRVILRWGLFSRNGRDLPLNRVAGVSYHRSLLDRMLGCGTLTLTSVNEGTVVLPDVPQTLRVYQAITELLYREPPALPEQGFAPQWNSPGAMSSRSYGPSQWNGQSSTTSQWDPRDAPTSQWNAPTLPG